MSENPRLSSEEVEALPWQEVESSNVARVAWVGDDVTDDSLSDTQMGVEYVEFAGSQGRIYSYAGVPVAVHRGMVEADSVGGYLNAEVKPSHPCTRIEVVAG
jgi:KTSC domain